MYLQTLQLTNYKCYSSASISFSNKVISIHGLNGSGKTNLLDAIHFVCIGKSYFNPVDKQNIQHGKDFFRIEAEIEEEGEVDSVVCVNENGKRKQIKINDVPHQRLLEHIGRYPVVVIAPDDVELINGGSEERRRFMDFMLSFTDRPYLEAITKYNKILQQRNSVLKKAAEKGWHDERLLQSYDEQLIEPGMYVYQQRTKFIDQFHPLFYDRYEQISNDSEQVGVDYQSDLSTAGLDELLKNNRSRDALLQRTTKGIHRDELHFSVGGEELKKYGSQGQKKSFLTALKLAQFSYLEQFLGKKPILLLDDIFDKLDEARSAQLLKMITAEAFGQVFITDTSGERLKEIFEEDRHPFDIFEIRAAKIHHHE